MESIGFKEWAVVCQALGEGKQNIILRKGGIAEGRDGFAFRHRDFFLFPTYFHEQLEKTRLTVAELPKPRCEQIEIRWFATVEHAHEVDSLDSAEALEPMHVLQSSVVRERFSCDGGGRLHVAFVRVFRLKPIWRLPDEKSFCGCRSWVQLPKPPPAMRFVPVLTDDQHAKQQRQFYVIIGDRNDQEVAICDAPDGGSETAAR